MIVFFATLSHDLHFECVCECNNVSEIQKMLKPKAAFGLV